MSALPFLGSRFIDASSSSILFCLEMKASRLLRFHCFSYTRSQYRGLSIRNDGAREERLMKF